MKNLVSPTDEPKAIFTAIANVKREPRRASLLATEATVHQRYDEYLEKRRNLNTVPILTYTEEIAEPLLHCYLVETQPLADQKSKITNSQESVVRGKCQYCGLNEPTTFDHYLPKELFPEFSVLIFNLLMCCPQCNLKKGTQFEAQQRLFIHFYYDDISALQFLSATANLSDNLFVINFSLQNQNGIESELFSVIENHFKKLELLDRYSQGAAEIIESARLIAIENAEKTVAEINLLFNDESVRQFQIHGINSWKGHTWRAISQNNAFIQWSLAG